MERKEVVVDGLIVLGLLVAGKYPEITRIRSSKMCRMCCLTTTLICFRVAESRTPLSAKAHLLLEIWAYSTTLFWAQKTFCKSCRKLTLRFMSRNYGSKAEEMPSTKRNSPSARQDSSAKLNEK
jgi:hypothetical protein